MHFLLTDEANLDPRSAPFFVYGGIFFPAECLGKLDGQVRRIREAAGYKATDVLKFDTNARPAHVTPSRAVAAKNDVVQACLENGVGLIAYALLHKIASKKGRTVLLLGGLHSVIRSFHRFLDAADDCGICLVDRLPLEGGTSGKAEFARLLSEGLRFPDGSWCPLPRIKLYSETHIHNSHIASAVDIVLGCFRYCVTDPKNPEAAKTMMKNVVRMMWKDEKGKAWENGFILRPMLKNIKIPEYRAEYEGLRDRLRELLG